MPGSTWINFLEYYAVHMFKCLASLSAKLLANIWSSVCTAYTLNMQKYSYFPELQKNGDFPRPFKRPHMETSNKKPMDTKKSQCKSNRWPRESKEIQKEPVNRTREQQKPRKTDRYHEADEDFPRGPKSHSSVGGFKTHKSHRSLHRSSHFHKPREDKLPKEGRRGKQKERRTDDDDNDNLFLIKQRKKKSKL